MNTMYPEHLLDQYCQQKNAMDQYYNSKNPVLLGKPAKSSLEMLRLSCEQLQAKSPPSSRHVSENKTAETICSAYDKMSEADALTVLKKKILKDTTHCHLWMFLFDILMDSSKSNVATWEDQKGMFRIRDPTRLAEMWGEKRNRTNMTYEKLSRSLRHYYEKKILRKVPKRKYTYKFNSREILKSYEVQPFYRRSNSNQSQRQNSQSQLSGYKTASSSGQSSPFTPITPSPSYHQQGGFNWNHIPTYSPTWQENSQIPTQANQMSPNAYHQVQPAVSIHASWSQQGQQCFYQPASQPTPNYQQTQSVYTMNSVPSYPQEQSFLQDINAVNNSQGNHMLEDSKLAVQQQLNQAKCKTQQRPAPLTITTPSLSFNSNTVVNSNQIYNRSQSLNSYESEGSPNSFDDNEMLYDLVDSLVRDSVL